MFKMPRPAKFTDKQRAAMLAMYHELDKNGKRVYFKTDICKKFKVKMATLDYYIDAANKKNGKNGHKKPIVKVVHSKVTLAPLPTMPEKAPELPMNVARVGQREYEITHVVKVSDTVDGLVRAADCEVVGELINLGVGQGIAILEVAKKIMELLGVEAAIEVEAQRVRPEKSEVMALVSNNAKAKRVLGWQPRTGLVEGLTETIAFIRSNLGQYRADEYGV
jgi:hypothetical protein